MPLERTCYAGDLPVCRIPTPESMSGRLRTCRTGIVGRGAWSRIVNLWLSAQGNLYYRY